MTLKYFPPSQYTPDLYTGGNEFLIKQTNQNYIGYYFKTLSGKYYTGNNPNSPPTLELILLKLTQEEKPPSVTPEVELVFNWDGFSSFMVQDEDLFYGNNQTYNLLTGIYNPSSSTRISKFPPNYSISTPSQKDYDRGFFKRYFLKKNTENTYGEIQLNEYQKFVNSDPSTQSELFSPVLIVWVLKGKKEEVYKTNKNRINLIQTRGTIKGVKINPWYNFVNYFNDDFTKYYK